MTAATRAISFLETRLPAETQAVKDSLTQVKASVMDAASVSRTAAADAVVKASVAAGVNAAAQIAPDGNKYEKAAAFIALPDSQRNAVMLAIGIAGVAILLLLMKGNR